VFGLVSHDSPGQATAFQFGEQFGHAGKERRLAADVAFVEPQEFLAQSGVARMLRSDAEARVEESARAQ
jgi:hypothetical protein